MLWPKPPYQKLISIGASKILIIMLVWNAFGNDSNPTFCHYQGSVIAILSFFAFNLVDDTKEWNESVVVLADLNAGVGNKVIEGIVGQHGVIGRNESGERLLEICAKLELVVGNSWFKKTRGCEWRKEGW